MKQVMKTMMLSRVQCISLAKAYCKDMFSFLCSNSMLTAQELNILGKEHVPYELNTIGRRLRT